MSDVTTLTAAVYATLPITGVPCPACGRPTWIVLLETRAVETWCPACGRRLTALPEPHASPLARALREYVAGVCARLPALGLPRADQAEIADTAAALRPLGAAKFVGGAVLVWVGRRGPAAGADLPAVRAEAARLHAQLAAWVGPVLTPQSSTAAPACHIGEGREP